MVVKAAGFIIFRRNFQHIEYLLMQASYGSNHWTPPKGHVDEGESDYMTAVRETQEESGIAEQDLNIYMDFKRTLEYTVNGKLKAVTYWLAELIKHDTPIKLSDEHLAYKWLPLDQASQLSGYKEFSNLLTECNSFITTTTTSNKLTS